MDRLEMVVMLEIITDMTNSEVAAAPDYIRIAAAEALNYITTDNKPGEKPGK